MKEITADQIFNLHPKITWAGFATLNGELSFAKMRPNVESLWPPAMDESFAQLGPMLVLGVCDRLVQWVGPLDHVTGIYEKVALVITKLDDGYLAITINRSDLPFLQEITEKLKTLGME